MNIICLFTQLMMMFVLLGAPPSSVGKYGGDTDNWMWPRHTGDFSMFRVYGAPDGSPVEYAKENIPITPKTLISLFQQQVSKKAILQ